MNIEFDRKLIKKKAKKDFKIPYWRNVFIALLVIITITGTFNTLLLSVSTTNSEVSSNYAWEVIVYIVRFYNPDFLIGKDINTSTIYAISSVSTTIVTRKFSFPFYVAYSVLANLNTLNKLWLAIFGIILYILGIIFIAHPLHVGGINYFLKRESDPNGEKNTIIQGAFNKYYLNIVYVKLVRAILYFLWSLTLVMIPVKYYSYYYVDAILCDNPTISPLKAIKLSEELTKGNKMNLFKKDLSLLGYRVLGYITFGLFSIFYFYPYNEVIKAKIYFELKERLFVENPQLYKDGFQSIDSDAGKTPIRKLNIDYNCDYKLIDYILIFFIFGFIGYVWEVIYYIIKDFRIINRGTLWGPILPIYGIGGVTALFVLRKVRNKPWLAFILSIVLCLTIEYFTAWYFETFKHVRYWSYDDMPFNIQGRICLFGGLTFGLGCIAAIYIVGPLVYERLEKISLKVKWTLAIIFICLIVTDLIVTHFYPNTAGMEKDEIVNLLQL